MADRDRGRGISDNRSIVGRPRDSILQVYSQEHILEITRDRNEHLTKGESKKIRANCAEILKKNYPLTPGAYVGGVQKFRMMTKTVRIA